MNIFILRIQFIDNYQMLSNELHYDTKMLNQCPSASNSNEDSNEKE